MNFKVHKKYGNLKNLLKQISYENADVSNTTETLKCW